MIAELFWYIVECSVEFPKSIGCFILNACVYSLEVETNQISKASKVRILGFEMMEHSSFVTHTNFLLILEFFCAEMFPIYVE